MDQVKKFRVKRTYFQASNFFCQDEITCPTEQKFFKYKMQQACPTQGHRQVAGLPRRERQK